jgi:CRISPR/Cas system-associated endonuclease Cas1
VLDVTEVPWVSVSGYGAHIKASRKNLFVQKRQSVDQYPLDQVKHLLVVGGHTIDSSAITRLVREGSCISFFEPDGAPAGIIRPYGSDVQEEFRNLQRETPRQRYAVSLARGSLTSRLIAIERAEESKGSALCYAGELELMHDSLEEMSYLIKLDEIRRIHRLTSDMYYEILARGQPPVLGFRRRTMKPQTDPVNVWMLSILGYAHFVGSCCVLFRRRGGVGAPPGMTRLIMRFHSHEGSGSLSMT